MPDDAVCERDGCSQPATVTVEYSDPEIDIEYCGDCAGWAQFCFGDDIEAVEFDDESDATAAITEVNP